MNFETAPVEDQQVRTILDLEEGHLIDLKAVESKPAKISRSISAFANTSGGELYIGIDELKRNGVKERRWRGFADPEAANGLVQTIESLDPLGNHYSLTFLKNNDHEGVVAQVTVLRSSGIIRASDGIPYIRRGAQCLPVVTDDALRRLELDKGIESFESELVDLELDEIQNSLSTLRFMLSVIPNTEPADWLQKQRLVRITGPPSRELCFFAMNLSLCFRRDQALKYSNTARGQNKETVNTWPLIPSRLRAHCTIRFMQR